MAYDAARKETIVFGGRNPYNGPEVPGTWLWNGTQWRQASPASSPALRWEGRLTYDPIRQVVVLFGGGSRNRGADVRSVWEWSGTDWSRKAVIGPQTDRELHAMAFHWGTRKIVLFGGLVITGQTSLRQNDTWEWDGQRWVQRFPANRPEVRLGHRMASAPWGVVMFGGTDRNAQALADTWEWDGTDWNRRFPRNSPPRRLYHAMVYDSVRGRVVLFGGESRHLILRPAADTWEWDGNNWTKRDPLGAPLGRRNHGIAFDSERERVVVFGGERRGNPVLGDTWEYYPQIPATFSTFGFGCSGTVGRPKLGASRPWAGDDFFVSIDTIPATAPVALLFGVSRTSWGSLTLPVDLSAIGMPGCLLYSSGEVALPMTNLGGAAGIAVLVPGLPSLVGQPFFCQGFVRDPGANPLGMVSSNAGEARIGGK